VFATGLVASLSVKVPGFVLVNQSHSLGKRLSQIERKSKMRQINGDLCGGWNDLKKEKEGKQDHKGQCQVFLANSDSDS
jgi:hypothetical protein